LPPPILRASGISNPYTPRHPAFLLVARQEIVVDEVVIKLYEKDHVLGISDIQSQMCIGMRYECLPKCVEGDDVAGGVVEGIRCLA